MSKVHILKSKQQYNWGIQISCWNTPSSCRTQDEMPTMQLLSCIYFRLICEKSRDIFKFRWCDYIQKLSLDWNLRTKCTLQPDGLEMKNCISRRILAWGHPKSTGPKAFWETTPHVLDQPFFFFFFWVRVVFISASFAFPYPNTTGLMIQSPAGSTRELRWVKRVSNRPGVRGLPLRSPLLKPDRLSASH